MPFIQFFVEGHPKAQPRPRATHHKGHARVYDPATAEGWKGRIAMEAIHHRPELPHLRAVSVELTFRMPRPKSHFGTGKNEGKLKDSSPFKHLSKPDIDNMEKAVLDELTMLGFWRDDSQITDMASRKRYTKGKPGVEITIDLLDSVDG